MHISWNDWMKRRTLQEDFQNAKQYVKKRQSEGVETYPPNQQVMHAFDYDLNNIKVVILGQDPYHGPGQAHGLSFSVLNNNPPPSLNNIFKEIQNEGLNVSPNVLSGCLDYWAQQGVFLLNSYLTVERAKPKSHRNIGWQTFTDSVIEYINDYHSHLVFMLWGKEAQNKSKLINNNKHLVLTSPHPSGFSAHKGFFGNNHFIKANEFLNAHERPMIDW